VQGTGVQMQGYEFIFIRRNTDKDVRMHTVRGIYLDLDFDKIPRDMREILLIKLANDDRKRVRRYAADIIIKNFDKIPRNLGEELLMKFSNNCIAWSIVLNMHKFPEELLKKLIEKFAKDQDLEVRKYAAVAAIKGSGFKHLPEDFASKIIKELEASGVNMNKIIESYGTFIKPWKS